MNPKVDDYLSKATKWRDELEKLRAILLGCGLAEDLKWGKPCYTFLGKNIAVIQPFKEYCALLFPKGALMKDPQDILVMVGENTQVGRQIRLSGLREIVGMEAVLRAYVREATEVEKSGREAVYKDTSDFETPVELQEKMDASPALKSAFEALTPGRQRGYLIHFAAAKQSKTREARIEKCIPQILCGKGLFDCTCGLSKKMPGCDGSHKQLRE